MVSKEELLVNAIQKLGRELIKRGDKYTDVEMYDECVQNLSLSILETEFSNEISVDDLINKVISSTFDTLHNLTEISGSLSKIRNQVDMSRYYSEQNQKLTFLSMNKLISRMVESSRYQKGLSRSIYDKDYIMLTKTFDEFISSEVPLTLDGKVLYERERWARALDETKESMFNGETCDGFETYLSITTDECYSFLKKIHCSSSLKKYFACKTESKEIENYFFHLLYALSHVPNDDLKKAYKILSSRYIFITYETWVFLRTNLFDTFYFINPLRIFAVLILSCRDVKCNDDRIIIEVPRKMREFIHCITDKYGVHGGLPSYWKGDKFYENIHTIMNVH